MFEYFIDIPERKWKSWEDIVPPFQYVPATPFFEILVPTIDTVRFSFLAETLLDINRSVFYTGQTGVGKTVVAADLFKRTVESKGCVVSLSLSSLLCTCEQTQLNECDQRLI